MIAVNAEHRIVFIRGLFNMGQVHAAVLEVTGKKRLPKDWAEWLIVGLADEQSRNIVSGMPFSPPDDRLQVHGFRRYDTEE